MGLGLDIITLGRKGKPSGAPGVGCGGGGDLPSGNVQG